MGIVLGYGTESTLSTTTLASDLAEEIMQELTNQGVSITAGKYKENFISTDTFLQQKRDIMTINSLLLENNKFNSAINAQIEANFGNLIACQKDALRYVIARNVSFQYVTGLYEDTQHHHHPFAHHGEGYQAVALDGITMGQHDPRESGLWSVSIKCRRGNFPHTDTVQPDG